MHNCFSVENNFFSQSCAQEDFDTMPRRNNLELLWMCPHPKQNHNKDIDHLHLSNATEHQHVKWHTQIILRLPFGALRFSCKCGFSNIFILNENGLICLEKWQCNREINGEQSAGEQQWWIGSVTACFGANSNHWHSHGRQWQDSDFNEDGRCKRACGTQWWEFRQCTLLMQASEQTWVVDWKVLSQVKCTDTILRPVQ